MLSTQQNDYKVTIKAKAGARDSHHDSVVGLQRLGSYETVKLVESPLKYLSARGEVNDTNHDVPVTPEHTKDITQDIE